MVTLALLRPGLVNDQITVTPKSLFLFIPPGRLDVRYLGVINEANDYLSIKSIVDSTWAFIHPSTFRLHPNESKKVLAVFFIPQGESSLREGEVIFQTDDRRARAVVQVKIEDPGEKQISPPDTYKRIKAEILEKEAEEIGDENESLVKALKEEIRRLGEEIQLKEKIISNLEETVRQQSLQIAALTESSDEIGFETLKPLYESLNNLLTQEIVSGDIHLRWQDRNIFIMVSGRIAFDSGRISTSSKCNRVLMKVGEFLKDHITPIKYITIKGHTDTTPIGRQLQARFPSNWELSATRASAVVRVFEDAGIPSDRLLALGCSSGQPISDNVTVSGRTENRRIEIIISTIGR